MIVLPSIADLAPGIMAALLGLAGFAAVKREHGRVMSRRAKRASDAAVETPPPA